MQDFLAVVSSEVHLLLGIKCGAHSIYTCTQILLTQQNQPPLLQRRCTQSCKKAYQKLNGLVNVHWLHLFPVTTLKPNQVKQYLLSIYYVQVTSWLQTRSPNSTAQWNKSVQNSVCISDIQCSSKTEISMNTEGISHNTATVTVL